ncbi:hypothetical protein SDC9_200105 [bioreactor metagenome]|uniref:Uncharacterized protein n=1 Tax=bioreactor metagenome TaxID=1076179 RepID=A0A645IZ12_9ZZZZ
MSRFLCAHGRQHRLNAVQRAKEVHVELGVGVRRVGEFHRAGDAEARVVDQQVDLPFLFEDGRNCGLDLLRLGYVRRDMANFARVRAVSAELIDRESVLR